MSHGNTESPWTDGRVEQLKKLFDDGLSAARIAAALGGGISRNAVIGKCNRMGWTRPIGARQNMPRKPRAPRPRRVSSPHGNANPSVKKRARGGVNGFFAVNVHWRLSDKTHELPPERVVDMEIPVAQRRALLELTTDTCRWPVGDPAKDDFFFCGATAHPDKPYCRAHCTIAYQPPTARRQNTIDKAMDRFEGAVRKHEFFGNAYVKEEAEAA